MRNFLRLLVATMNAGAEIVDANANASVGLSDDALRVRGHRPPLTLTPRIGLASPHGWLHL